MDPQNSVLLKKTKEWFEVVEAVKPRRRDFWGVLTGRYQPQVVIVRRLTMAGFNKVVKEEYSSKLRDQLNQSSLLGGTDALAGETTPSDLPEREA